MDAGDLNVPTSVAVLIRGGVIAYPAERAWALGCIPFDGEAVHRLLAITRRPVDRGLVLVAARLAQLDAVVDRAALPEDAHARLQDGGSVACTYVVPANRAAPAWITGGRATVALRVSAHPVVRALCERLGGPLVCTGAALAGNVLPRDRNALSPALLALVDGVCGGDVEGPLEPIPVVDAISGQRLRD